MIQLPSLQVLPWLRHAFTTRAGGVSTVYGGALNLGLTVHDDLASVLENRRRIVQIIAGTESPLFAVRQVHGTAIHRVRLADPLPSLEAGSQEIPHADAIVTERPGILLGIQTADCVPILLVDTRLRVVAAVHAGWRGTASAILEKTVSCLREDFKSDPAHLLAAIGPAIGGCCYSVGDEVRERFWASFDYADQLFQRRHSRQHLDLAEANRRQLLAAGLAQSSIAVVAECTACTRLAGGRKFFSHRDEAGVTGRAMGIIGIAGPGSA